MTGIAPMTPPECDLRGLPFMPLDVVRLVDSDLFALTSGDEFKAAVTLWCKAWLQVPAASLPNDDRVLAHLSGTGARWRKCREMALHGFVLCEDNRWYHPVVAEKAREAWKHRLSQRERAAKRWAKPGDTPGNADAPAPGNADTPSPGTATADATASPTAHAVACPTAMQGTGRGRGTVPPDKSGGAPKPGNRLPAGFAVPPDWRAWAATDRGWSTPDVADEAASFVDYWHAKSGKDAAKLDWEATWRNWCRRSHRKPGGAAGGSHIPGGGTPLASPC